MELSLQISDDLLRILDQVSDPVTLLGADFQFIWINNAYSRYMGLSPEKIISMQLSDVTPLEYSPVLKKKFRDITIDSPSFDNIYPSVLADGSIIVEKWHNEGVFDDNGNLRYYYCIANLKNNGDNGPLSLKESDLISNTLIKSSVLGIIISIDSRVFYINQKACDTLNLEADISLEEIKIDQLFQTVFPNNYNEILGTIDNSQPECNEIMIENNTEMKWVSIIRKYQMHNGKKTSLFLIEDITDRKLNELEMRNAKNNLSEVMRIAKVGYWEKDFRNDCWLWSDEIYSIFNIPKGTRITEKLLSDYYDSDTMQSRNEHIDKTISSETESYSYQLEYMINFPDGTTKWVAGESFYEKTSNGSPGRFYGWVQDVTLRKNFEKNLLAAKEKAEESERLKTAFLANMSHEIRTPLNAILGFSDLLTKTTTDSEKDKFKKIINQSSSLLLKIIDDILDISSLESGSFELFYEEIIVEKLLTELIDFYSDRDNDDIRLIIKHVDEGKKIYADKVRLKQVLINLINNAYKYTTEGTIRVLSSISAADKTISFSVRDTGAGIEPEKLGNIFNRFYQIDSFSKGTGLGLSISKSIIEQMNGTISVQSNPGTGSEFTITLPSK